MSQVAAMAAAITALQAQLGAAAPTQDQIAEQIHTIVDPQVKALNDAIAKFEASELKDEGDIGDLTDAIGEFTAAFAPAKQTETAPQTGASS